MDDLPGANQSLPSRNLAQRALVSIFSSPLLAAYAEVPVRTGSLITEQVLMVPPRLRGTMRRANAWPMTKTLSALVRVSVC